MSDAGRRAYRGMSEPELLAAMGYDHYEWAVAFSDCNPSSKCDTDVLATWFANAMIQGSCREREGREELRAGKTVRGAFVALWALVFAFAIAAGILRAHASDTAVSAGFYDDFGCANRLGGGGGQCAGLTRPANTTPYASGQLVCAPTCAPLPVVAGRVADASSGSGIISKVVLIKSGSSTTNANFNVYFYAGSPNFPALADQSAYVGPYLSDITSGLYIGVANCTNFNPTNDASPAEFSVCQLDGISSTIWHYRTTGRFVYAVIAAAAAYTPASAEKFYVGTYEQQD